MDAAMSASKLSAKDDEEGKSVEAFVIDDSERKESQRCVAFPDDVTMKDVKSLLEDQFEQQHTRLCKDVSTLLATHELQMERLVMSLNTENASGAGRMPYAGHSGSSLFTAGTGGLSRRDLVAAALAPPQSGSRGTSSATLNTQPHLLQSPSVVQEETGTEFSSAGGKSPSHVPSGRSLPGGGGRTRSENVKSFVGALKERAQDRTSQAQQSTAAAAIYTSANSKSKPTSSAVSSYDAGTATNNSLSSWRAIKAAAASSAVATIRRDDMMSKSSAEGPLHMPSQATTMGAGFYPVGSRARRAIDKMEAYDAMRKQNAYNAAREEHMHESSKSFIESISKAKSCQQVMQELISDVRFEIAIFFLILANVVLVGIEVDYTSRTGKDVDATFVIIDSIFTGFFVLEVIMRIIAQGRVFLGAQQRWWNLFDCFVILTSVIEMVSSLFLTSSGINIEYIRFIRIARVTRFLRAVRLIRLVRFIRALRTLVNSIFATLKSLVWAMLLILMVFYGFGVAMTQTVSRHIREVGDPDGKLEIFWGNLTSAMFTLYKAISGGLSWHEAVYPLEDVGEMMIILFLIYITFTFFAVLNVITGVFCQSAIDSAAQDKEMLAIHQMAHAQRNNELMQSLFREIDEDGSGSISIEEFEKYLQHEEVQAYFASLEIDTGDAWMLFKLLDKDGQGSIDLQEFLDGCLSIKGGAKAIHMVQLQQDNKWIVELMKYFMEDVFQQLETLQQQLRSACGTHGHGGLVQVGAAVSGGKRVLSFGVDSCGSGGSDRMGLPLSSVDEARMYVPVQQDSVDGADVAIWSSDGRMHVIAELDNEKETVVFAA